MSVHPDTLHRAVAVARALETQGYFEKVRLGDQRAASYFARLVAYTLNPTGIKSDFGWLSKVGNEAQVDGYAEDAICYGNDPNDRMNAIDMVNGAGLPGASIGGAVKERRAHNVWVKPVELSTAEMLYLRAGIPDPPPAAVRLPSYAELGDDAFFRAMIGVPLFADYLMAGQSPNDGMSVWFARAIYRLMAAFLNARGLPIDAAGEVRIVRNEWRKILGLPPV